MLDRSCKEILFSTPAQRLRVGAAIFLAWVTGCHLSSIFFGDTMVPNIE